MPAKNKRRDAKRDANEKEIVDGLALEGYLAFRVDEAADLIVWHPFKKRWGVMEVKVPDGRLTKAQKQLRIDHPDMVEAIPVVRSVSEALRVMDEL